MRKLSLLVVLLTLFISACTSTVDFKISFDSNGGSLVEPIITDGVSSITTPKDPVKEGFTFAGWYWDNNTFRELFTINSLLDRGITNDLTVYAKWSVDETYIPIGSVKVTFNTQGGTDVSPTFVLPGRTILIPSTTKEGYTLDGWYTSVNGGVTLDERWSFTNNSVNNDITLYAKWNINTYTITFDTNGGTSLNAVTQNFNTSLNIPNNTTKTGYSFTGWFEDDNLSIPFDLEKMPSRDFTLYAKWTINAYTITFDSNGGTDVISITQDYASEIVEPNEPTRVGYTFEGWFTNSGLTNAYAFTTMPAEDITLYAKWIFIKYTITYELNDGTNHTNNPTSFNVNSSINLLEPTKIGHTFAGWYLNSDFSGNVNSNIALGTTGNLMLFAKWTINSYTITFDSNGGIDVAKITQYYASEVNEPIEPTRNNYIFDGWFTNSSLTSLYEFTTMPAKDITLYAKWKEIITLDNFKTYVYTDDETYKDTYDFESSQYNPLNSSSRIYEYLTSPWFVMDFDWAKGVAQGVAPSFYDFSRIRSGQFSINALEYNYVLDGLLARFPIDVVTQNDNNRSKYPLDNGQYLDIESSYNLISREWHFELKKSLTFEDGRPINSDVIIYSIQQYLDPRQGNSSSIYFFENYFNLENAFEYFMQGKSVGEKIYPNISFEQVGIKKIDEYTFSITSKTFHTQLQIMEYLSNIKLVHPHNYEIGFSNSNRTYSNYGSIDNPLVSYGPYVIREWNLINNKMTLNKNIRYHSIENHNFKSITLSNFDSAEKLIQFNLGNLNTLTLSRETYPQFKDNPGLYIIPGNSAFRLAISLVRNAKYTAGQTVLLDPENPTAGSPLVQELAFRRALYFAIDRLEFAQEVFPPAVPNLGMVSSIHKVTMEAPEFFQESAEYLAMADTLGINTKNYGFDQVKAKQLFDEAYASLVSKNIITQGDVVDIDYTFSESEVARKIADWMKDMLESVFNGDGPKRINIVLRGLDIGPGGAFSTARTNGDFDLMLTGISGATYDAAFFSGFVYNNYVGSFLFGKGHNPGDTPVEIDFSNLHALLSAKPAAELNDDEVNALAILDSNGVFKGTFHEAYTFYGGTTVFDVEYPGRTQDLNNLTVALEFVVLSQGINVPLYSSVSAVVYDDVYIDVPARHSFLSFGGSRYRWLTSDPDFINR
jgi:uncharacterized repeat protein (TIGR02543 family)